MAGNLRKIGVTGHEFEAPRNGKHPYRSDIVVVLVLVGLGAALRVPLLRGGLWRDEASTYYAVIPATLWAVVAQVTRGELNPPGYFIAEHVWTLVAGTGEVALKLPSFLCSLGLIPVAYALARQMASRWAALLAALFAAVSPTSILLSAQARPYAMAGLMTGLGMCAYTAASTRLQWRLPCVAAVLLFSAAVYTHYTAGLVVALLACGATFISWRSGRRGGIKCVALALAGIAALFAPWIANFVAQAQVGLPWSPRTTAATFVDAVADNVSSPMPLASHHSQLEIALAAILLALGIRACVRRRARSEPNDFQIVLGCCTLAGATLEAAFSMREPRFMFVFSAAAWVWWAALVDGALAAVVRWNSAARAFAAAAVAGLLLALVAPERVSRRVAPLAESGVPALAPMLARIGARHRTLYLVAPDYLGPTFGYYVGRKTGTTAVGFARWRDPQLFMPAGYLALWTSPDLVTAAERRIATAMHSYDRLCLLRDRDVHDSGLVPFSRTKVLLSWLRSQYRELRNVSALGNAESVTLEQFGPRRVTGPASR